MANYFLSAIIELLNPDNTISAHRMLAHAIGMNETIIYSALISKQTYYARNGMLMEGGWFYSTICDLQESTTYGAKAQRTAINHLISHGLIECENKGLPAKRYFRIIDDTENLNRLIEDGVVISENLVSHSRERIAEKSMRRTSKQAEKPPAAEAQPPTENAVSACGGKSENRQAAQNPCSYPAAGTSGSPSATSCSRQQHNKTKDNNKPNKLNRKCNSINQSRTDEKNPNVENVENVEKTERKTFSNYKPMTFSETLKTIGVDWYDIAAAEPKTEKNFAEYDEDSRLTKFCTIPYSLKKDKRAMKYALQYLSAFSYYFSDYPNRARDEFYNTLFSAIAEMTEQDSVTVRGQTVMYYEIIDRLNEIIHNSYLSECFIGFEEKWREILSEKEIKHRKAYMKSCIWLWLNEFEFEMYSDQVTGEAYWERG